MSDDESLLPSQNGPSTENVRQAAKKESVSTQTPSRSALVCPAAIFFFVLKDREIIFFCNKFFFLNRIGMIVMEALAEVVPDVLVWRKIRIHLGHHPAEEDR